MVVVSVVDVVTGEVLLSESFAPTADNAGYSLSADVAGEFQVMFSTDASENEKRVYVDNISVFSSSAVHTELVESVEKIVACEYRFAGLEPGCTYSYRVQAGDGRGVSGFSAFENVVLLYLSVDEIVADGSYVEVYTLSGVRLYNGHVDGIDLNSGVYIIKSPVKAVKAVVK